MLGGNLAAPWGVALAPSAFGKFGGDLLLVGNFGFFNSEINAFNPVTDAFEGSIDINGGARNAPGGRRRQVRKQEHPLTEPPEFRAAHFLARPTG
jgi:hypothetical protein